MAGDAAEAGRSLVRRAQAERHAGRSAQAIALYAEAAEIARRGGDILTLANRLRHIGDIHLDEGHVDLAAPFYDEALTLYRSRGDTPPLDLANLLRPLALLREKQGEREAARYFGRKRAPCTSRSESRPASPNARGASSVATHRAISSQMKSADDSEIAAKQ
jgi:tetratricopeptide (TPR) repeat protein